MRVFDLFSGTGSVSLAARSLGHEAISLDYAMPADIQCDLPKWDLSRMRDYITDLPYVCVDYCMYCDWGYRKRTRLWTNIPFEPRTCDGSGACGNMEGKRHRVNLIDRGGYLHEKYRVPKRLIVDLLLATASV